MYNYNHWWSGQSTRAIPFAIGDTVCRTIQVLCMEMCGTISYGIISYRTIQRSGPCHTSTVDTVDLSCLLRTHISQQGIGLSVQRWEWRTWTCSYATQQLKYLVYFTGGSSLLLLIIHALYAYVHILDPSTSKLVIRFQWLVCLILLCSDETGL